MQNHAILVRNRKTKHGEGVNMRGEQYGQTMERNEIELYVDMLGTGAKPVSQLLVNMSAFHQITRLPLREKS